MIVVSPRVRTLDGKRFKLRRMVWQSTAYGKYFSRTKRHKKRRK